MVIMETLLLHVSVHVNVTVCSYYEWHRSDDGKKQPYFIYFPSSADHSLDGNGKRTVSAWKLHHKYCAVSTIHSKIPHCSGLANPKGNAAKWTLAIVARGRQIIVGNE